MKKILNLIKKLKRTIVNNKNVILFSTLNISFFAGSLLCCLHLSQASIEWLYFSINPDVGGTILSIILAITTIIITIEITIRQFFYNRINKKVYMHTFRNAITVVLFFILSILFAFRGNQRYFCCIFIFSICAIINQLIFISFDIALLDSSRTAKPLFNSIINKIRKKTFPKTELKNFVNLLRDCMLNNECIYAEKVIRYIPKIVSEYLKIKHSLDLDDGSINFNGLYSSLYEILMIVKENYENVKGSRVIAITSLCLAEIVCESIKYGSEEVIHSFERLVIYFFAGTSFEKEWKIFVFSVLENEQNINKNLDWIISFFESDTFSNQKRSTSILESIAYLITNNKIELESNVFHQIFSFATKASNIKSDKLLVAHVLVLLWQKISTDLLDEYISYVSVRKKCFNCFEVSYKDSYPIIVLIIEECLKKPRGKEHELKNVKIVNTNYYLYYTKRIDAFINIDFSKNDLVDYYSDFEIAYISLITNGDANDIRFFGEKLLDVISSINRNEDNFIQAITRVLIRIVESVKNSDSKEKVDSVIWLYQKAITKMDENSLIDDDNYKIIIDMHFNIVDNLYYSKSIYCATFYRTISEFDPADCTFKFINNKSKKEKIEYILKKVYICATSAIEDLNDEILSSSSSYIGFSLLFFLFDNNLFYKDIMNKFAIPMFDLAISLNYKESMLYFLATLFVVNISFCLGCKSTDARFMFGLQTLNKMRYKQLKLVSKAINLRKSDCNSYNDFFGGAGAYSSAISKLEVQVSESIKNKKH